MKILNQFTKWFTRTGKGDRTTTNLHYSDYNPDKDYYQQRREVVEREHNRLKKWKKELESRKMSNITGHYPGSIITNNTLSSNYITNASTSIADSAITIDGNDNNVSINRPLVVNDRDILQELDEMRDSLLLLKRDVDMEAKYPRLKELKEEYEAELAKYKTFDALKESK